jgi:hypothetical protein
VSTAIKIHILVFRVENDKIEEDEVDRHVARMGEKRNAYRILMGRPEGNRPLRTPRRRWVDNIKMDLGEIGCGGMDWIDLVQDRGWWSALVNTVMNRGVP